MEKIKNRLSQIAKEYIDIVYSFLLVMTLFYSWFLIEKAIIVSIICILMEIYVLYYGDKRLNKWAMLNIMIGFARIVYIMN